MKRVIKKLHKIAPKRIKKIIERIVKKIDGGEYWSKLLREIYKESYGIDIGIGTYGAFFQERYKYVKFGAYTSIASGFEYFPRNHPKDYATMHPIFYNTSLGFVKDTPVKFSTLEIGNDVWIGKNVMVTSKCNKIGNGAIIGAGSVVTKNVEPYTIVAGNPAKIIGKRFENEQIIELLEESKWYQLSINELKKYSDDVKNPEKFAKKIIKDKKKSL